MPHSFSRQAIAVASPPLLAAVLIYLVLKQGLPRLADHEPAFRSLAERLVVFAPVLGAVFAAVAVFAVVRLAWRRAQDTDPELVELRAMAWPQFSAAISESLRRQGYNVSVRESVGIGDVELIATRRGEKLLVQGRQWRKRSIGVDSVRELCGAITAEKANRGLFITCGAFTLEAMRFAKDLPISLIDGTALLQWVHGAPVAIRTEVKAAEVEQPAAAPRAPSIERGMAQLRSNAESTTPL